MTETKCVKISVREIAGRILGQLGNTLEISSTKAMLANLRNSIGRDIENSVDIWPLIFEYMPEEFLSQNGTITVEERALIVTLQLYALHQQGISSSVNATDRKQFSNIGSSLKFLRTEEKTDAIDRRFNALVTASTFSELEHHLRYLVKMLRSKGKGTIKINYTQLANDLFWYQLGKQQSIKLNWGRSYYSHAKLSKEEITNE